MEATKQWQKETGRKNTWPDLGAMLTWQFDRIRRLEESLKFYGRHRNDPESKTKFRCKTYEGGECNCGFDNVLEPRDYSHEFSQKDMLVCVICGRPWVPSIKNRCNCGGFCTWGDKKGGEPSSWQKVGEKYIPRPVQDKPNVVKKDGSPENKFRKD